MNCECITWARVPTDNLPPSDHHPTCQHYKLETFIRLEYDGSSCVMEPHEAANRDDPETEYRVTEVQMTRDQFERLPDFGGF